MSIKKRKCMEDKVLEILNICRTPKTKHFVKDHFNFSNDKLKEVLSLLQEEGVLSISIRKGDKRGIQDIVTTELGKEKLRERGIKY